MNKISKLALVQHTTRSRFDYYGWTVQPGFFFGRVHLADGRTFPAAWSGWTCSNCIALYVLDGAEPSLWWVDWEDFSESGSMSVVGDFSDFGESDRPFWLV